MAEHVEQIYDKKVVVFNASDFYSKLLADFAKQVDAKKYSRIPYKQWKVYKSFAPLQKLKLHFETETATPPAVKITNKVGTTLFSYCQGDGSFGDYLFNKYMAPPIKEDVMTNYNSNTISTSSSTNYWNTNADGYTINTGTSYVYTNANPTVEEFQTLNDTVEQLQEQIETLKTKLDKENEKDMKGFNFDFGPCDSDAVRMSMYGLAIQNIAGTWVSYDKANHTIVDVDILNFNGGQFMYKIPVALKDVKVGDIIVNNRVPMFITDKTEDNKLVAVDVRAGEEKSIIPVRNMFGFDFVTKIVSLFDMGNNVPTADNPFGNMLPFLMLNDEDGEGLDPALFLLASQGGQANFANNPMLMYFLFSKDKSNSNNDFLPLLFLSQMNQPKE